MNDNQNRVGVKLLCNVSYNGAHYSGGRVVFFPVSFAQKLIDEGKAAALTCPADKAVKPNAAKKSE